MKFCTGKKAARYDARTLQYADYRDKKKIIIPPVNYGHYDDSTPQMFGNDQYGDCVWAGAAEEILVWNGVKGVKPNITTDDVLGWYATTGFKKDDPSTDQGTDVLTALNMRVSEGLPDSDGTIHKLGAYMALEPGNYEQLIEAGYIFGAVGIGWRLPQSAEDQSDRGKVWAVVSGSEIVGGHYTPYFGRSHKHLIIRTWAMNQPVTKSFYDRYCDEAYVLLSPEYLNNGVSPEGFNLDQMKADLAALKGV